MRLAAGWPARRQHYRRRQTTDVSVQNNTGSLGVPITSTSRLRGLTYIHTCRSYVHTPRELDRHVSNKSLEASHYNNGALADSSDFGLLGEQSSAKCTIPCLGRRWTAVQTLTPLALSSAEKSVTVQTHTHTYTHKITKQTNTQTNSKRYIQHCLFKIETSQRQKWLV